MYLNSKGHSKGSKLIEFEIRVIHFPWTTKVYTHACGVFTMIHCCKYQGEPFEFNNLLTVTVIFYVIIYSYFMFMFYVGYLITNIDVFFYSVANKTKALSC